MREVPPRQLVDLLRRLGLADARQIGRMGRSVRKLARDLPKFESVWIDALAQSRLLTPFQAAEIRAGRGDLLRIGPYVLCELLTWPDYVSCFRAQHVESREVVRLAMVAGEDRRADEILQRMLAMAATSRGVSCKQLSCITAAGTDSGRIWAASRWVDGPIAATWMVQFGRFPPKVVLEIARDMLVGLARLESVGLCHGDISAAGLTLTGTGDAVLLQPGIRTIVRPEEGYAHANLQPQAYDYLAPERITEGTPPTTASDVYACGCVWWHLLCGRTPLAGGDSLGKVQAAGVAKVPDVRRLVHDTPEPLATAISACVQRDPSLRPESMARLAAMVGSPTPRGSSTLARCLSRNERVIVQLAPPLRTNRPSSPAPLRVAAVAGCVALAAVVLWPNWPASQQGPTADISTERAAPVAAQTDPKPDAAQASSREATAVSAQVRTASTKPHEQSGPEDLVLASKAPLRIESLQLSAGQCVRGAPGQRPSVLVPRAGLNVDVENTRFENIDFIYDHSSPSTAGSRGVAAIIDLRAAGAEFYACSFRSHGSGATIAAAVRWTFPVDAEPSTLSLPSGRLRLRDCVLQRVAAGVACRTVGAVTLEVSNTLQTGLGPLVHLDHCPKSDEPVLLSLSQVTLRASGPLLECDYQRMDDRPGEILVRASGCVFVPAATAPLLRFVGRQSPEHALQNVHWTGQGSLVSPEAAIATWQPPDGRQETLDDTSLSIAGLVRGRVGFSGGEADGPSASRAVRWQAPLRSTDPPGIDPSRLPEQAREPIVAARR